MSDETKSAKPAAKTKVETIEADNRAPRELESRDSTARDEWSYIPPSLLPDPAPTPGWNFRWIKIANGSSSDQRHVSLRFREGWRPVTPEEQPEIADTLPKKGVGEDRIVIGELMLCKIPAETVAKRRAYFQRQAAMQIEGVTNQLMSQSDARMPILNPVIQTTVKGSI